MTHAERPILRVVRMDFRAEECGPFDLLFEDARSRISAVPGCLGVTCFSDVAGGGGRTTFSVWQSERALEAYRESALFKEVWALTKPGFQSRPVAWSMPVDASFIASAAAYLGASNDSPCWP
jgi:heme-degrading monooxygenase HmoA